MECSIPSVIESKVAQGHGELLDMQKLLLTKTESHFFVHIAAGLVIIGVDAANYLKPSDKI